jgi:2-keto-3-deoxy-L-rhamnonate aldolase RhmA
MNRLAQAIRKKGAGPLLGAATYFYDPTFLEIAALVGYQVAWIEMEHTFITFAEAADLCRIASGLGMLTMIRIPNTNRTTVLKAAECGPDILDLPMANSPEELRELVHHARFPPDGIRGFFSVSRAVGYGLTGNVSELQQQLNRELCLMIQVETREAVDRAADLCAVDGVEGIFLGPADLSASLGVPGQTGHSLVYEAAARTIRAARGCGKQVAVGAAPDDFPFWVRQEVDVLFCTNDIACLKLGAQSAIRQARAAIEEAVTKV